MSCNREELKKFEVTLASEDPLIFQCDRCGLNWKPLRRKDGKLTKNHFICLNQCNTHYLEEDK